MTARNEIRELLLLASTFDGQAREARRAAGRVLARIRSETPDWHQAVADLGLDARTADLLVRMACGMDAA